MPEITVTYSPSIELITAAAASSDLWKEEAQGLPAGPGAPDPGADWRAAVRDGLSAFERADLDLVFSTVSTFACLSHTVLEQGWHHPEELIAGLAAMDAATLRGRFRDLLQLETVEELADTDAVRAALEADRAREPIPFAEEARRIVSALAAPLQFRDRTVSVLQSFWNGRLAPELPRLEEQMQPLIAELRASLEEDRLDTLAALTGGNLPSLLAETNRVVVYPVAIATHLRVMLIPDDAYLLCGRGTVTEVVRPTDDLDSIRARTDELLKAIADPTRLRILRLIQDRSRYGKELADELGVSPGTASYHVDKLIQARLLRVEHARGRRFYYGVNPAAIRDLQRCLGREFLSEDAST